jgi:hypothetical protein
MIAITIRHCRDRSGGAGAQAQTVDRRQWAHAMERFLRLMTWPAAFQFAGVLLWDYLLWHEQYKLTRNPGSV